LNAFLYIIYYTAVQGFEGNSICEIKISADANLEKPSPEEPSIFAFNFISGFLCLVFPVIFVLLLIHAACSEFSGKRYNKVLAWKILWIIILSYLAISIVIGVAQLGLSFYVASLIYPAFDNYKNETLLGFNQFDSSVTDFDCDQSAYLSAFISLTLMYILIFISLAVLVAWLVNNIVNKTVKIILENIDNCLKAMKVRKRQPRCAANNVFDGVLAENVLPDQESSAF